MRDSEERYLKLDRDRGNGGLPIFPHPSRAIGGGQRVGRRKVVVATAGDRRGGKVGGGGPGELW